MGDGAKRIPAVVMAFAAIMAAGAWADPAIGAAAAQVERRCDGARVFVRSGDSADFALVCAGARDAVGFFADLDFDTAVDVDIEVVENLPVKAAPSAVGCYLPERKRVYVLSPAAFRASKEWFGVAIEPALYRSVIAHEVAHAVAACQFKDPRPSLAAVEYVGYVAMFSAMEPGLRQRVLAPFPGDGYDSDERINDTIYLIDPTRFAVESYRHFLRLPDRREYLRAVFAGKRLVD